MPSTKSEDVSFKVNFTIPGIFALILFGSVGLAAFVYGKKQALMRPLILGVILMVYPYFIAESWLLYLIGVILTLALFFPRQ